MCRLDSVSVSSVTTVSVPWRRHGVLCVCGRGSDALALVEEQQPKIEALGFTVRWAWWPSVQAAWQLGHHKQVRDSARCVLDRGVGCDVRESLPGLISEVRGLTVWQVSEHSENRDLYY